MTAKLELHLKLDGFQVENRWHDGNGVVVTRWNLVEDSSGNNHTSALFGNADIVADDAFGACADFDGDVKSYIKVPSAQPLKIAGDVTLEAWVYITKAATGWVRVIGKGTSDSRSYGLWYQMTGTTITCLFQRGDRKPFDDCTAVLKTTPLNTWYHLAGVVEGKKSSLYVHDLKGKLIGKAELDHKSLGATLDNDSHVTIGHSLFPNHAAHSGKIAHARIYNGALSQAEIERDISSDRLALVPFRKSHPIDFHLSDEDDQPALYIVDDSADAKITSLKVELTNSATQAIHIPPAAPATDRDHYHFALRFRPGTLSASTIRKLTALTPQNQATVLRETDHWELAGVVGLTGPVTLYVSYRGPKSGQGDKDGKLFLPEEQLTLTLHGISADAGSGSRGTQVELIPHQLTYEGDDTPITGSRMRYIHITNHRGQKNIPLHVWLVDGNTVLNDGHSETPLKLRISNGSGERDITLNERSSKEASKFVISFDVGEAGEADWALTDPENAKNVRVMHGENELTKIDRGQGASGTFKESELTFLQKTVLAKRGSGSSEHVEITLERITTALSGHANLYVRYEGIPGYQDGQFILTVEKSPLVSDSKRKDGSWDGAKWNTFEGLNITVGDRNAKPLTLRSALRINDKGHVGIGTDRDLVSNLTVNKKIAHDAGYDYSAAPLSIFLPKHNGGSTPAETVDILHLVREGVASAAYGNKVSLAIGRYENNGLNSRTQLDIKLTDGPFTDHKAVLSLRSNGCVGIGTGNPQEALQIGDFAPRDNYLKILAGESKLSGLTGCAGIKLECGQHNNGYSIAFDKNTPRETPFPAIGGLRFSRLPEPGANPTADLFLDYLTGCVGIGTDVPGKKLDVRGELQVTASHDKETPDIGTFYDMNKTRGIGIGYNQIAAIGERPNQSIVIAPKGTIGRVEVRGPLKVEGNLTVNGLPIFNFGKRMTETEWRSQAAILKSDASYRPGCFILFVRENKSDDLCCLVKKPNNEVRLLTLSSSSNGEVK